MVDLAQAKAVDTAVLHMLQVLRRGTVDLQAYRDVVLGVLLLKFVSDIQQREAGAPVGSSPLHQLTIAHTANFSTLLALSDEPGLGDRLDAAFYTLALDNPGRLDGVQSVQFRAARLGEKKHRDRILALLLQLHGTEPALDFQEAKAEAFARAAAISEKLLTALAAAVAKRGAEFYTPPALGSLAAELLEPRGGESIMDPCCGSAGMLIACGQAARTRGDTLPCGLFGQEINGETVTLAKLNLTLHDQASAIVAWGDVLGDPKFRSAQDQLSTFDVVVASPPFNESSWPRDVAATEPLQRFWRGVPPASSANYAFISHMVESMSPQGGRMAVVVTHGVLARGGAEGQIRNKLVEENLLDAVIALPAKLFPNTAIPVAMLIFRRNRPKRDVVFVDASKHFEPGKTQNTLTPADVERIVSACREPGTAQGFARAVPAEEIAQNDFSLHVPRYIRPPVEEEDRADLTVLRAERNKLQLQIQALEGRLARLREGHING